MAISKKEAKQVFAILEDELGTAVFHTLERIKGLKIKNKSFNKSFKRIRRALEQPKKAAVKKAA